MTGGIAGRVGEANHARRLHAAGVDAEQAAAAEGEQLVLVEDLDLETGLLADRHGLVGEHASREVAGWRVGEIAGERGGGGRDETALATLLHTVAASLAG